MFDFTRFELIASSRCFPGTSSRASSSSLPLAAKIKTKQNKTKKSGQRRDPKEKESGERRRESRHERARVRERERDGEREREREREREGGERKEKKEEKERERRTQRPRRRQEERQKHTQTHNTPRKVRILHTPTTQYSTRCTGKCVGAARWMFGRVARGARGGGVGVGEGGAKECVRGKIFTQRRATISCVTGSPPFLQPRDERTVLLSAACVTRVVAAFSDPAATGVEVGLRSTIREMTHAGTMDWVSS